MSFVSNLFQLSFLSCHLWYALQARDSNAMPTLELSACWSARQDALADSLESCCQMECIWAEICLSFFQQDSSLCPTLLSIYWFTILKGISLSSIILFHIQLNRDIKVHILWRAGEEQTDRVNVIYHICYICGIQFVPFRKARGKKPHKTNL